MLEYLLKEEFEGEDSDLLSNSKIGWIKSISTISCPHNGTILADIVTENLSFLQKMTPLFGAMGNSEIENFYDFDLDQWNFKRKPNESVSDYLDRISDSKIKDSKKLNSQIIVVFKNDKFNCKFNEFKNNHKDQFLKNDFNYTRLIISILIILIAIIVYHLFF